MSAITTALIVGFLGLQVSAQYQSTCSPRSASACPTAYDPCCRYICAEAQVPFPVCQPTDGTGQFASCSACPYAAPSTATGGYYSSPTGGYYSSPTGGYYSSPTGGYYSSPTGGYYSPSSSTTSSSVTPCSTSTTLATSCSETTPAPVTTTAVSTPCSLSTASTCSPYSASVCPTTRDHCCKWLCRAAQVPFPVCQPTDGTGPYATCVPCHDHTSTSYAPYVTSSVPFYKNTTITTPCSTGIHVITTAVPVSSTETHTHTHTHNTTQPTAPPAPPSSAGISTSSFMVSAATTAVIGILCLAFAL